MKLKKSLFTAVLLCIWGLTIWEFYWRTKPEYYKAYLEDDRNLWAEQRAKAEKADSKDVILIGMSRTGYNFNTHIWEDTQGIKPIHLTMNGKSPIPVLEDLINNTNFNGTIIMGIVPIGVFTKLNSSRSRTAKTWVKHYYNRTYAQRLGFILSKPLQRHLVMLSAGEMKYYNNLDLKSLLNTISIDDNRVKGNVRKLVNIGYNDDDRNLIMFPRLVDNPKYQKEITDHWDKGIPKLPDYSEKIEKNALKAFKHIDNLVKTFKSRGGKIIFIRHKAEEGWYKHATRMMPRGKVWDKFIETVNCPGYHFEDYEFMSKHTLPDWSHMHAEDAKTYTRDMVNQLINDGHLIKHN
jgi:hypothetical protein